MAHGHKLTALFSSPNLIPLRAITIVRFMNMNRFIRLAEFDPPTSNLDPACTSWTRVALYIQLTKFDPLRPNAFAQKRLDISSFAARQTRR